MYGRSMLRPYVMLGALSLLAAALRVWKADWALPYVPHPDEPAVMNTVLRMLRTNDPNPHFFYYPSLWIYVQAFVGWLHLHWGMARGWYTSAAQLPKTTDIATSVPGFFVWGRIAAALAGAATVPALYLIARRIAGPIAGLIAAALLTVNAFHITHSHYIMPDVPSELFTALALIWTLRILDRGAWRDYLIAGALTGLAAGMKHNAALAAVAIVAAHGLRWRANLLRTLPRLVSAGVATIGSFLVTSPYIILAFPEFRADLGHQLGDYAAGAHGDVTGAWPISYYFNFYRDSAVGTTAGLLAVWGTIALIRRRDWCVVVLWVLVLAYLIVFLAQGNHWMRNMIATQIPLFALAGVGAADVVQRVQRITPRLVFAPIAAALLLALLLPSSVEALQYSRKLQRGDSRVQVLHWIEAHVPPGVQIAAELKPVPGTGEARWVEVNYLPQHDLAWYRQQGYAFLIASSDTWRQRTLPDQYVRFAGRAPVAEFGDPGATMLGPKLVVYNTGLAPQDVMIRSDQVTMFGDTRLLGATLGTPDRDDPRLGMQPTREFNAGTTLGLRTFWQVDQPFDKDYFVFVHVVDATGNTVAQRDTPPWQGRFPTSSWQAGTIVVDVNDVTLPPTLPSGEYTLLVGMFDPSSGEGPPLRIAGQAQGGNSVTLSTIVVGKR